MGVTNHLLTGMILQVEPAVLNLNKKQCTLSRIPPLFCRKNRGKSEDSKTRGHDIPIWPPKMLWSSWICWVSVILVIQFFYHGLNKNDRKLTQPMANLSTFGDYICSRKNKVETFISWSFGWISKNHHDKSRFAKYSQVQTEHVIPYLYPS